MRAPAKKEAMQQRAGRTAARENAEWKFRRTGTIEVLRAPKLAEIAWLVHGFSTRAGGASEMPSGNDSGLEDGKRESSRDSGGLRGASGAGSKASGGNSGVLNLGFTEWDSRERVAKNREKFFRGIGAGKLRAVALRQIHSDVVQVIGRDGWPHGANASSESAPQGDALVTAEPGILLAVHTADCVPILLADMKRKAVAAIHSGWRGTRSRIAAKALGRMR